MVRNRRPEPEMTYESLTPERGADGAIRRAIDYFGRSRGQKRGESRFEETSAKYYDVCGWVSAEGLEKLVVALQADESFDDFDLKHRPYDPYDMHSTRLNGWTDLRPQE